MKDDHKMRAYLAIIVVGLLLSACSQISAPKPSTTSKSAMLLDKDGVSSPYALVRVQERPVFHLDDKKRPYATIEDRVDRAKVSEKPSGIQESKPK